MYVALWALGCLLGLIRSNLPGALLAVVVAARSRMGRHRVRGSLGPVIATLGVSGIVV